MEAEGRQYFSSSGMPIPSKIINKPSVKPFPPPRPPATANAEALELAMRQETKEENAALLRKKKAAAMKKAMNKMIAATRAARTAALGENEEGAELDAHTEGVYLAQMECAQILANGAPLGLTLHSTPFDYAYAWDVCKSEFDGDIVRWYLAFSHLLQVDLIQEAPFLGFHLPFVYQPVIMVISACEDVKSIASAAAKAKQQRRQLPLSHTLQANCVSYPMLKPIQITRMVHASRYIQHYVAELHRLNNLAYAAEATSMRSFDHQWVHFSHLLAAYFQAYYQEGHETDEDGGAGGASAAGVMSQSVQNAAGAILASDVLCFAVAGQFLNILNLRFEPNLALFISRVIYGRMQNMIASSHHVSDELAGARVNGKHTKKRVEFRNHISSYSAMNRLDLAGYFVTHLPHNVVAARQHVIERFHAVKYVRAFVDCALQIARHCEETALSPAQERAIAHDDLMAYRRHRQDNMQLARMLLADVKHMKHAFDCAAAAGVDNDVLIHELVDTEHGINEKEKKQDSSQRPPSVDARSGPNTAADHVQPIRVRLVFDWLLPVDRAMLFYAMSKLFSTLKKDDLAYEHLQRALLCLQDAQNKTVPQGGVQSSPSGCAQLDEDLVSHRRNIIDHFLPGKIAAFLFFILF